MKLCRWGEADRWEPDVLEKYSSRILNARNPGDERQRCHPHDDSLISVLANVPKEGSLHVNTESWIRKNIRDRCRGKVIHRRDSDCLNCLGISTKCE